MVGRAASFQPRAQGFQAFQSCLQMFSMIKNWPLTPRLFGLGGGLLVGENHGAHPGLRDRVLGGTFLMVQHARLAGVAEGVVSVAPAPLYVWGLWGECGVRA